MTFSKMEIPKLEKHFFSEKMKVRVSDVNYGGHLGYDSVLVLAQECRLSFLQKNGLDELNLGNGVGWIVKEAAQLYINESKLGDQIEVRLGLGYCDAFRIEMLHDLVEDQENKEIARVKTLLVGFNYKTKKLAKIPQSLFSIMGATSPLR